MSSGRGRASRVVLEICANAPASYCSIDPRVRGGPPRSTSCFYRADVSSSSSSASDDCNPEDNCWPAARRVIDRYVCLRHCCYVNPQTARGRRINASISGYNTDSLLVPNMFRGHCWPAASQI
ncbi:unnamed protein product [Gongylonema pulchrum]|uniref:Uncharacterized protein n=1 Tax=Gongylonema pulchrum TaxID=637853 RepID=A0A183EHM3_9BILA|nr:unnamed protein product [Gongylonema pulchrum]